MATVHFDPTEGLSEEQKAVELEALRKGEEITKALEEDQARRFEEVERAGDNPVELIGGKFKTQADLLKAYEELQAKLGKPAEERDEDDDADEEPADSDEEQDSDDEGSEEAPAEVEFLQNASDEFYRTGKLSDEVMDQLAQIDSRKLVETWLQVSAAQAEAVQQQVMHANEINAIFEAVGGEKAYQEMVAWAAENLEPFEIERFNAVTATGNSAAISYAVEALQGRYRGAVGYEAPMVRGKKAGRSGPKPLRSHAELARAIQDPRWHDDPAYRADIEARLAVSGDLL